MPNNLDFDEEADLVEWVLKVSIPDNEKVSAIHGETVWEVTNLEGLIKLSKSCPSFFLQAFVLSK